MESERARALTGGQKSPVQRQGIRETSGLRQDSFSRPVRLCGSYSIAQRNREIGIRIALGATQRGVIWMALRETLPMVLTGLAGGSFLALVTTRFLSTFIFGLTATDPETIALAIMLLIFAAGLATYLPARRAARVDPTVLCGTNKHQDQS